MKSIRSKLIVLISIFVIISAFTIGFISYYSSRKALENQVYNSLRLSAQEGAKLIESRLETQLTFLETLSEQEFITDGTSMDEKLKKLSNDAKRMGYEALAIVDDRGNSLRTDGSSVDVTARDYYKQAMKGISNISDVLISSVTNKATIIYAVPVRDKGKVIGVLYGVRNGDNLSEITDAITLGDSGYAFMVNKDGTTIAHPNRDLVLNFDNAIRNAERDPKWKQLAEMETKMIKGKVGVDRYEYNGKKKIAGYAPVSGTGWSIAVTADLDELFRDIDEMRSFILGIASIVMIACIITAVIFGTSFAKPVAVCVKFAEVMSKGDFTEDIPAKYRKRKDEIGKLAKAFDQLKDGLKGLISQTITAAEMVGATSQELSASVEEISSSAHNQASLTEEVSSSMEEMSANIHAVSESIKTASENSGAIAEAMEEVEETIIENTRNLEEINRSIADILAAIEETSKSVLSITEETKSASIEAEETEILAKDGKTNLDNTVREMESIQSTIMNLSEVINGLGESASQIGDITSLIKDVAEQTNLLALNASIEAARAGEHGKGFAVVAQAIGSLAEQSQNATKEISTVIKNIQSEISKAVESSREGTAVVENGTELVMNTSTSLDRIFASIRNTSAVLKDITEQMEKQSQDFKNVHNSANVINDKSNDLMAAMEEEMAQATEIKSRIDSISSLMKEISNSMEEQSAASEQVSDAINENAAGIEEISSGSEDIAKSAEELAQGAQNMLEQVKQFKI